jgi:rRNA maturation endonuclease Nob1
MEYGTKLIGEIVFCANCGRVVSQNGVYDANFCFVCGNPLKPDAVSMREQEIAEAIKNIKQ